MSETKKLTASQKHRENAKKDLSPKWDNAESLTGEQFSKNFHESLSYYNLNFTSKDLKPKIINWMGANGYSKSQIDEFKNTKDWRTSQTMGSIASCLLRGMPESHPGFNNGRNMANWLRDRITAVVREGKADTTDADDSVEKTAKPSAPVVNIQDRIREQAGSISEELDYAIDSFIQNPDAFDPKSFKIASLLRGKGAKAAQARYIKGFFEPGHKELTEAYSPTADEQLKEAYSHLTRKNIKKLLDFYESIVTACDQISAESKVLKKPRKAKVKPAEDIVKRLKFRVSEDKLGITSVPPAHLIGAQAAVVYNVRTRKIGYYIASNTNGLSVKGTTLTNYTDKSTQKTLRKPPEQLKEFKGMNTQKRFETWYAKEVKTTETILNGRFNEDTVILKVYK